jgi:hypothetical protein
VFLGHFAAGLAAKRAAPGISLGTLFLAAQLADLLWPILVLAGIERVKIRPGITAVTPLDFVSYPWSHSLLALSAWGVLLGLAYAVARRGRAGAALLVVLVLSHWILDVASHRPDMPLAPGTGPKLGFGLWSSLPATLAVELGLFALGVALYARATTPRDRTGTWALSSLVGFMTAVYLGSVFGPAPPSSRAVAWSGLAMWLLIAWGYWIDRHRRARAPSRALSPSGG